MGRKVTIACMTYTDGKETIYGVYHATLREPTRRAPYVDIHKARHVGNVKKAACCDRGGMDSKAWYLSMARQFETPDFPAFSF